MATATKPAAPLPEGLRIAQPEDEARLLALLKVDHAENGMCSLSIPKTMAMVHRATREGIAVIGLIDGPERIEAAACLDMVTDWYTDDWIFVDRFVFVHPAHRRSRHAFKLLRFTQWVRETTGYPVVFSIHTLTDLERKTQMYRRFGRHVGATFLFGEPTVAMARAA